MFRTEKRDGQRWFTLAVICLSLLVITIDNTILNVALPTIVRDLDASGTEIQWILDAYIIVFASLLLTAGALGDKYGRKKILTLGLVLFGGFSGAAGLADSPSMLIAARGLMGVGAALIFPTTLSILTNVFRGEERARAIGIWSGVAGVGIALGPIAGGLLVEHFHWGSVFLVNVPLCTFALVFGHFFIPPSRDPKNRRLDVAGSLLSIVALVALLFAIIQAPDHGWTSPEVLTSFAVALALFGAFAWRETHTPEPMLDIGVFRNPRFTAASAVLTLSTFALFGSMVLLLQYFQLVLDYSPLEAGFLTLPLALGIMIMSPYAPRLVVRWGTKRVVVTGLLITAVATLFYASNTIMSTFVGGCIVRFAFGSGMGLTQAPATESIMGSLPRARAGVGSAINDTTRQTGGALGVAVIGSIFLSTYHHFADKAKGLGAASAAALHDSVGRAMQHATALPTKQGEALVALARAAFIDAMRYVYPVAACVLVLAAVVAWRFLPARAPTDEVDDDARALGKVEALGP
jgi:EmrB/QacA subfamily drug resistance transporter